MFWCWLTDCLYTHLDFHFSKSQLYRVVDGREQGLAWIVDPMLPSTETKKYSGTLHAGKHDDIYGQTCDALAHYSLESSDCTLVLVDIQGRLQLSMVQYLGKLLIFVTLQAFMSRAP